MRNDFLRRAEKVNRVRRKRGRWTKIISIMACAVVFCTTYALILPALTIESGQELICTETDENHVHTAECYRQPEILPEEPQPANPVDVVTDSPVQPTEETPSQEAQTGEEPTAPESGEARQEERITMRHEGADYTVTVAYGKDAGLPENVELSVRELEQGSWEYQSYYDATVELLEENRELVACRFFDVSFLSDGTEVEPKAPVDVQIDYAQPLTQEEGAECTAVHFADTGVELLDAELESSTDGGDTVTFTQDSFSVVGTAVTTLNLSSGSYIFYKDGYAIGAKKYGDLFKVPVTVDEHGYVYPKDTTTPGMINYITWTYSNGYLRNVGTGSYMNLKPGATTSTSPVSTQVRIINNAIRFSCEINEYDTATGRNRTFYLGFDGNNYTSKSTFDSGSYFLAAKVANVSDNPDETYALEIKDNVRDGGTLIPDWTNGTPGGTLTYRWERSSDGGKTWKVVERRCISGDECNVAEDGSWLNVALDGGADKDYRLTLVTRNGQQVTGLTSHVFHVPYHDSLQNGDFEDPVISTDVNNAEHFQPLLPNGTAGMVWKTTASDGLIEFVSVASPAFQQMSKKWHNCPEAASGNQFVELNATMDGALYQDVLTTPGSAMYWQLSHRGRGTSDGVSYPADSNDTMYVLIMSTKLAEQYNVTTQDAVKDVIANIRDKTNKYPGAEVKEITSDCKSWTTHGGRYGVPDGQYLTRYFFVSGDTAYDRANPNSSLKKTVGNHLDNVYFSTELPPPNPGQANLKVVKTVKGLSEDEARYVFQNLKFTVKDWYDGTTYELTNKDLNFKVNEDDTYTGTYMMKVSVSNPDTRRFTVTEQTDTANAPENRTVYNLTVSAGTTEAGQRDGMTSAEQLVKSASTAEFYFTNTYVETHPDFSILKTNDKFSPLQGASFELDSWDGETWQAVTTLESGTNGRDNVLGLWRNTLYRLTETKAPAGFQLPSTRIYFKIERVGRSDKLMPYNADGTRGEWPTGVSLSPINSVQFNIVNYKGMVLPNTGGTGTTGIYLAGAALMGAAVLYGFCGRKKRERA